MELRFDEGANGFHQARALLAIARAATLLEPSAAHELEVSDALKAACEVHLAHEEFTMLRAEFEVDESARGAAAEEDSWWAKIFGPSRREQRRAAPLRTSARHARRHSSRYAACRVALAQVRAWN